MARLRPVAFMVVLLPVAGKSVKLLLSDPRGC